MGRLCNPWNIGTQHDLLEEGNGVEMEFLHARLLPELCDLDSNWRVNGDDDLYRGKKAPHIEVLKP